MNPPTEVEVVSNYKTLPIWGRRFNLLKQQQGSLREEASNDCCPKGGGEFSDRASELASSADRRNLTDLQRIIKHRAKLG